MSGTARVGTSHAGPAAGTARGGHRDARGRRARQAACMRSRRARGLCPAARPFRSSRGRGGAVVPPEPVGPFRPQPQSAGAVATSRSTVTRLACPAVKVEMVVVRARDWERGIYWASQFGPFCQRTLVLSSMPAADRDRDLLLVEARMFGIGVIISGRLTRGGSFRRHRSGPGERLRASGFSMSVPTPQLRQSDLSPGTTGAASGVVQPVLEGAGEGHLPVNVEG